MSSKALLSFEEEKILLERYCLYRDAEAKLKLFNSHVGLVRSIVGRYYNSYKANCVIGMEDLMQEGYCGLIKAIDWFDINKKNRLATFAVIHIESAVFDYITKNFGSIHISQYKARGIIKYLRAVYNFKIKNDREPTLTELTQILNCSEEFLQNTIQANALSAVLHLYEEDDCLLCSVTPENHVLEREKISEQHQISKCLHEGFDLLSSDEQKIIKTYYFGNGNGGAGKRFKRRSRPSKIELDALKKLRRYIIANVHEGLRNDLIKEGAVNV